MLIIQGIYLRCITSGLNTWKISVVEVVLFSCIFIHAAYTLLAVGVRR